MPPFTYRVDIDPTPALLWQRRYGAATSVPIQVFREQTSVTFESPVHFNGGGRFKTNIASEILKSLPRRDSVARLMQPNTRWRDDGLGVFSHVSPRYKIDIRLPMLHEVVTTILRDVTRTWSPSDKGRMGESIASTTDLAQLLKPGMFEAIRSLTTRRSVQLLKEIEQREHTDVEVDRARFVWEIGGRLERKSQAANDLGLEKSKRVDVAELLVAMGWADRGYRISCSRCDVTSFVEMDEVTRRATCPGCRSNQSYERTPQGITVYYRLNTLIDRASDQGVLPHLLAAAALHRDSPDTYVIPGVHVVFQGGTKSEVDLFGVHAEKVIAGEVKTSASEFTVEQVNRDIDLSMRLGADLHVMACMETLSSETAAMAQVVAAERGIAIVTFDAAKLRP